MDTLIRNKNLMLPFVFFFCSFCGSVFSQVIKFDGLRRDYDLKNDIHFSILNDSDSAKYYSIAIEWLSDDKKWIEIKEDIFNYTDGKKTSFYKIKGQSINKHSFSPYKYINVLNEGTDRQYRLRLSYGSDFKEDGGLLYSIVFSLH